MSAANELEGGAGERQRVDAVMLAKPPVLIGEQQLKKTRIDIGDTRRQPPAGRRLSWLSTQQPAVAIGHPRRKPQIPAVGCRTERDNPRGSSTAREEIGIMSIMIREACRYGPPPS